MNKVDAWVIPTGKCYVIYNMSGSFYNSFRYQYSSPLGERKRVLDISIIHNPDWTDSYRTQALQPWNLYYTGAQPFWECVSYIKCDSFASDIPAFQLQPDRAYE